MGFFQVLWSIFVIFLFVYLFWAIIAVATDVFRSRDMSGFGKAAWIFFIIVVPWLGVLIYLLVRGDGMSERSAEDYALLEQRRRAYIQEVAGSSTADELSKLADLRDKGVITDAEFEAQKAKLLA